MSAIQMVDVWLPTTHGRLLILPRYTQPDKDRQMLLHQLHLTVALPTIPEDLLPAAETVASEGETVVKTF